MRTLKVEGSPRLLMTLARPGVAKDAGRCVVEEPVMDKVLEIALALVAFVVGEMLIRREKRRPFGFAQGKQAAALQRTISMNKPLLGASILLSHSLEEGIAENAVGLSRSAQIANTCIKRFGIGDAGLNRGFANAFDHRDEGFSGEAFDEVRSARIHVDHTWRHVNRLQTGLGHQWIELAANQRIASRQPLQLDQALDGHVGGAAVGVEGGRCVVTLDDGDGATGSEQAVENRQHFNGAREVLQDETDEDMVARFGGEGP